LRAVDAYRQLSQKGALPPDDWVVDNAELSRLSEGLDESTAGRRLFELAAACRGAGIDPESALRRHVSRVVGAASRARGPVGP
jgi:XTP/dITP diphosphohydrolase/tetrapyrrole methylase family protein/MazG family protein